LLIYILNKNNKSYNFLQMTNKCLIFFLIFLITIFKFQITNQVTLKIKSKENLSEINDLIEYLVKGAEDTNKEDTQSLLETQSQTLERGLGCEAFSKCSGKGSCREGACVCDEGYDYFDCSVDINTSIKFLNFRKMPKGLQ